jgi:hypothetical protein
MMDRERGAIAVDGAVLIVVVALLILLVLALTGKL